MFSRYSFKKISHYLTIYFPSIASVATQMRRFLLLITKYHTDILYPQNLSQMVTQYPLQPLCRQQKIQNGQCYKFFPLRHMLSQDFPQLGLLLNEHLWGYTTSQSPQVQYLNFSTALVTRIDHPPGSIGEPEPFVSQSA